MRQIDDFYEALGARIRSLRQGRYTQQELAELVGLTRTSITNVERGTQRLMADQLFAVARALDTSVESLFSEISRGGESAEPVLVDESEMPRVAKFVKKVLADTEA
jgi:transcriptional regulator with XRE-family HTH domain